MIFLGLLLVQLQLFEGALAFVPKEVLAGLALTLATVCFGLGLGARGIPRGSWAWFWLGCLVIGYQWIHVSWGRLDPVLGAMSGARYVIYLAILLPFREAVARRVSLTTVAVALSVGLFVSWGFGVATDAYMFVNNTFRFQGASHSPAGMSLHASVCLLALLAAGVERDAWRHPLQRASRYAAIALCLWVLVAASSRQPQLGLVLVGALWIVRHHVRASLAVVATAAVVWLGSGSGSWEPPAELEMLGRSGEIVEQAARVAAARSFSELTESSALSRIDYMRVGTAFLTGERKVFGGGLNSFPGVYERYTRRPGRAPHNDFLLAAMDFGVPGLVALLVVLWWAGSRYLVDRNALTPYLIFYWILAWSLNNPLYYFSVFAPFCVVFTILRHREARDELRGTGAPARDGTVQPTPDGLAGGAAFP